MVEAAVMARPTYNQYGAMPVLPIQRASRSRSMVRMVQAASLLVAVACIAALASVGRTRRSAQLLQLLPNLREQALFQTPDDASMDSSSWMLDGILADSADTPAGWDPLGLDKANKPKGPPAAMAAPARTNQLFEIAMPYRKQILLGGDDWLGAPLAVPEDVRENGEQQIGQEVTYWNTHSGDIGTGGGGGYPY